HDERAQHESRRCHNLPALAFLVTACSEPTHASQERISLSLSRLTMRKPCFVGPATGRGMRRVAVSIDASPQPQAHEVAASLATLPTLLTSVKVFDGSEVTESVVVSDAFWSELSSKLPYLLLAQLLAAVTFVAIASLAASQGKFLLDRASADAGDEVPNRRDKSKFRRAGDLPPAPLDFPKLFLCIGIDVLGSANEAVPLVGELVDVVYAPMAALLLRQLFSGSNVVFLLEFAEEILPFTDILPLATICWVVESFFGSGSLARALGIGEFAPDELNSRNAIDVGGTRREGSARSDGDERPGLPSKSSERDGDNASR
ncbi:hypothetical protein ACHAWF_007716, partial [Thalassiosira exigua]